LVLPDADPTLFELVISLARGGLHLVTSPPAD
jgi:hypothetical protein